MPKFEYLPLQTPQTIRLVQLAPREANSEELVRGTVWYHDLDPKTDPVGYNALSYVWGDPTKRNLISLNNQDFWVTDSLMFFLKRPRHSLCSFWIDAICLDQDNDEEKASQIPRMKEIYENASCIHADLGPASEDEELAIEHIYQISQPLYQSALKVQAENNGVYVVEKLECPFIDPYDPAVWTRIARFLGRPWWKRAWIMQESSAIDNTWLLYGSKMCKFALARGMGIALSLLAIREPWGKEPEPDIRASSFERVDNLWKLRNRNGGASLLEILHLFRGLEASDERDIFYGAMCLASDIPRGAIIPTPEKTITVLHRHITAFYIQNSLDPLDILGEATWVSQESKPSVPDRPCSLPSWTPRWLFGGTIPKPLPKVFTTISEQGTLYSRIYSPWGSLNKRPSEVTISGNTLIAQGFPIDIIENVSNAPCSSRSMDHAIARESIRRWAPTERDAIYEPTGETMMKAFLRLVVMDLTKYTPPYNPYSLPPVERGGAALWDDEKDGLVVGTVNEEESLRSTHLCRLRNLAMSGRGYMALVSFQSQPGDVIFALRGGSILYVLRPKDDEFQFIGECYVHGFMDGEALKLLEDGTSVMQEVRVV